MKKKTLGNILIVAGFFVLCSFPLLMEAANEGKFQSDKAEDNALVLQEEGFETR